MVDDRVHRQPADQPPLGVDHRRGDQVVALEGARCLAGGVLGVEAQRVGDHCARHVEFQVGDDQPRQRQRALQHLVAIDDEQLVGVSWQLVEAPQVARHRLEGDVVAHRDVLEIHQRADRALGIGQRGAQLLALLRV